MSRIRIFSIEVGIEAQRDLKKAAVDDYELAFRMLGRQLSLDFLESSAWPIRSRMLELHLWSLLHNPDTCEKPEDTFPSVLDLAPESRKPVLAISSFGPSFDPVESV